MPIAVIDGQPLHYLDQGTGPAVLLGSSYLWDRDMWAPQIEALSQQYRVIVPELWGHGESGQLPTQTRSLDDLARQNLALLDHLDITQINLVGLSVGGMWGARLALQAPERINSLVLLETYLGAEPEATRQYYFSLFKMIEDAGAIPEPLLDVIAPIFFRPEIDRKSALYQDFRTSLQAFSRDRLLQSIVPLGRLIFSRDDVLEQLSDLDADTTLVMCGEQDKPRPPAESKEMAELIGCALTLIPDAGHISSRENPDFVNEALLTFLANHADRPPL
ncbi:alpha/beta fold hydrolase [Pseudomonas fluorescens]|uniref:alpha/beta fold hydrolase n=1 Tax=Pseudomonas fluorescens TaxID=294 RepID=UPI00177B3DFA|nr:alpha/beta fold hydrolase [Pseudomonas fluorescens]MBD8240425.1 alpha/beta fold hydrolase [Pseudomonas fluorescens]MDY0897147.1 alpha/beta fold hydrolase [Pseudomonas fluorescens]